MLRAGEQLVPGLWLTEPLGSGGFGDVWEARDAQDRRVAVKLMDCRTKSSSLISSEIRVLRGLAELRHPRFIQLFNVQAVSHYIVLIMERAECNLIDLLAAFQEEEQRNIPPEVLLEMLDQVAEGLDFLAALRLPTLNQCSRGLQHCDIKPANLLLIGEAVKIADFGLCAGTSWQTHRNAWRGTLPYAAPELYRGQPMVGTDQFALAITYLKLVVGERVFFPDSSAQNKPYVFPVDLTKVRQAELPVLTRALHPQPMCRWPSCKDFITRLRQAINAPRQRNKSSPSGFGFSQHGR
jgi:serine/threonine protein kinase